MTATKEDIRAIVSSPQAITLAQRVFMLMAIAQTIRKHVDSFTLPIFKKFTFEVRMEWQVPGEPSIIADPKDLYLCDDEEQVNQYFAELKKERYKNGYQVEGDKCPACMAEFALVKAENAFLSHCCKAMGLNDYPCNMDDRDKMLDLLLKLSGPFLTGARPEQLQQLCKEIGIEKCSTITC